MQRQQQGQGCEKAWTGGSCQEFSVWSPTGGAGDAVGGTRAPCSPSLNDLRSHFPLQAPEEVLCNRFLQQPVAPPHYGPIHGRCGIWDVLSTLLMPGSPVPGPGRGGKGQVSSQLSPRGPVPALDTGTQMGQTWGLLRTGLRWRGWGWGGEGGGAGETYLPDSITCWKLGKKMLSQGPCTLLLRPVWA